jgi:phosphoserine phosphatase SerB
MPINLSMNLILPKNKKKCCIFDFDSTLVAIETLDFLIAKSANNQKEEVEKITNLAMSGKMTFVDSLKSRFANIKLTKSDIENLKKEICSYITKDIPEALSQLREEFDIYIISGGFLEIIYPVAEKLLISKDHCFANNFLYKDDKIIGFDETNIMVQNGGKPKIVAQILENKFYEKIFMIGDGYTDLEVAKSDSLVNYPANSLVIFCGFGVHILREAVQKEAKYFFTDVASLVDFIIVNN